MRQLCHDATVTHAASSVVAIFVPQAPDLNGVGTGDSDGGRDAVAVAVGCSTITWSLLDRQTPVEEVLRDIAAVG